MKFWKFLFLELVILGLFGNCFLFYVLKNIKWGILREHILVVLCCFHLFFKDCLKKKIYANM